MSLFARKSAVVYSIFICIEYLFSANGLNLTGNLSRKPRYIPPDSDLFWPNKRVPYEIGDGFDKSQSKIISNAIEWWRSNTCVRWVKRNINDKNYVHIILGDNCSSNVGRIRGVQNLTMGHTGHNCFYNTRTIFHEMMHAVGFIHEHQRPDRDKYVNVYWDNIDTDSKPYFNMNGKRYFYEGYKLPYDIHSIMHCDEYMGSKDNITRKLKTIVAKNNQRFGCVNPRNCYPTQLDIKKINTIYKCY